MNPNVNWFFEKATRWQKEYSELRRVLLDCGLTEELKWGCPCYTFNDANIVLIHGFKNYCALLFLKGALLKDESGILIADGERSVGTTDTVFRNSGNLSDRTNRKFLRSGSD